MIRKSDIQWWVLEAKKHPESAPTIIEELAKRLTERKQQLKATEEAKDIQIEQDVLRGSYEQLLVLREELRRQMALAGKVTVIVVGAGGEQ